MVDPKLRHLVGFVSSTENPFEVIVSKAQEQFTLSADTTFAGPVENKVAFAKLQQYPRDLSVNLWVDDKNQVQLASPNWR